MVKLKDNIKIIKDVDLVDHMEEYDVVLVGTNTYCSMGCGFQHSVLLHHYKVQEANLTTKYGDIRKLGTILPVEDEGILFILCYIVKGMNFRPDLEKDTLNYIALRSCLNECKTYCEGKKVATTILGCSRFDGNGDKETVLGILNGMVEYDLTLYDYEQKSPGEEYWRQIREERKIKNEEDRLLGGDMARERRRRAAELKKKNGHTGY